MVFSVALMLWSFGGLAVDADELGIYQNMLFQKADFGYVFFNRAEDPITYAPETNRQRYR